MIAKLHGNTAGILTDGFYDEGSGAAVFFIFLKTLLQRVDVVDHHGAGILQRICGDSDCEGRAGVDGANVVDDMIAPAVIAALQLDDFVLAGKCARQSQRDHDGFGAAAKHTEFLAGGIVLADFLSQLLFILIVETGEVAGFVNGSNNSLANWRIVVAKNGNTAAVEQIDVTVPVDVVKIGAVGLDNVQRKRIVEREIVLYAAGNELLCRINGGLGAGTFFVKMLLIALQSFRIQLLSMLNDFCSACMDGRCIIPVQIRLMDHCTVSFPSFSF